MAVIAIEKPKIMLAMAQPEINLESNRNKKRPIKKDAHSVLDLDIEQAIGFCFVPNLGDKWNKGAKCS